MLPFVSRSLIVSDNAEGTPKYGYSAAGPPLLQRARTQLPGVDRLVRRRLYRKPSSIQISDVERKTAVRKLFPPGLILKPRNEVVPFSSPRRIEAGTGPKSVMSFPLRFPG